MNMKNFLKRSVSQNKESFKELSFGFEKFGTKIGFSIVADKSFENQSEDIFSKAKEIYEKYDVIFNRFDAESEISKLNLNLGRFQKVSKEILEVVEKALLHNKETEGYFDPRIADFLKEAGYENDFSKMSKIQEGKRNEPSVISEKLEDDLKIEGDEVFFRRKMDFSGIVKGLVNDKVVEFFKKEGFEDFVVDSGGDMYFSGYDVNGEKWKIDVEGVSYEKLVLEISGEAVATSGIAKRKWEKDGKRFHHLINPKNPDDFRFDLRSATVIDESTEKADVWAKTLFLMGKKKGIEFSKKNKIRSIFLDYSGNVWISPEMDKYKINTL